MISNITRYSSIARLAALVLLTICFVELNVRAQEPLHQTIDLLSCSFGVARGQTLRYTWANLNDADPQKRVFEPLRIQVKLLAADGSLIAQAEAPAVDAGKFQSFDFNRDQIDLPGEPGTARLQLRLAVRLEVMVIDANKFKNLTFRMAAFDDAADVMDTLTGQTTVSFKPKEIVVVGSKIKEN